VNLATRDARRPDPDSLFETIADYVLSFDATVSEEAMATARYCVMDSLACALMALDYPACTKLLGPIVPGAVLSPGARVPGTDFELDPVRAAHNLGTMIRWLDYNDTWLAAEWGHPSDNLGTILALSDYMCRTGTVVTLRDVLSWGIKAHEIQGVLALENSFNRVGLDHVLLVRIASTAVATAMMGGTHDQIVDALTNAWIDGGALRTYRHAPNTGSRKSWAAGDATSRGVWHALQSLRGEMGYPSALTAERWGFQDVLFEEKAIELGRPLGLYVMEQVLFKVSYPAEFHAQTAVEAAVALHPHVVDRLDDIDRIDIETQEAGARIIDKTGPLANPADRDHCIQYMVAVPLLKGDLTAEDYEDAAAADPKIDRLREAMVVRENESFTVDYFDAEKRAIPNAVQVFFQDGSSTERVEVSYPIGHRRRRGEAFPLLREKYTAAVKRHLSAEGAARILDVCEDQGAFEATSADTFVGWWCES